MFSGVSRSKPLKGINWRDPGQYILSLFGLLKSHGKVNAPRPNGSAAPKHVF